MHFVALGPRMLGTFWEHFRLKWVSDGALMGPWTHMDTKMKAHVNKVANLGAIWFQLGAFWVQLGLQLGPISYPNTFQNASKSFPNSTKTTFKKQANSSTISKRFWDHFGTQVGGMLGLCQPKTCLIQTHKSKLKHNFQHGGPSCSKSRGHIFIYKNFTILSKGKAIVPNQISVMYGVEFNHCSATMLSLKHTHHLRQFR